ncbi:hypothetical protein BN2475_310062 [Paraburkholderia ribeironis]|uniref:Uncharacterized protein n=1 Tax=Paraburkholderia ribeironis TaxID=1247936 RepID=A0A1N7S2E3_9BURK|nr:hypothetical protein BN2475_310062 [Paraburkholderia ribeironis]
MGVHDGAHARPLGAPHLPRGGIGVLSLYLLGEMPLSRTVAYAVGRHVNPNGARSVSVWAIIAISPLLTECAE